MRPLIMIPSRLASTRLPQKALADIGGKPMIAHVAMQAIKADLGPVIIAAGDQEIIDAVENIKNVIPVLTDPALESGSDRIYAALLAYDRQAHYDVIINLQGDLPLIKPDMIEKSLLPLSQKQHKIEFDIGTLIAPIKKEVEKEAASVVKAICSFPSENPKNGEIGRALYFSRAPAPWGEGQNWHHIGLYAWQRHALEHFVHLSPSPLEKREKLEQLRALEAGMSTGCAVVDEAPLSVDVEDDLNHVRARYLCR